MENFYRIRKVAFCVLVLIVILTLPFWAHAQYVDLKQGTVLAKEPCVQYGKPYVCVIVKHDDKVYVVLLDRKGEYEIYLVTEKESVLIWYRDAV